MTEPPPDWQVKVTLRDRGDLRLAQERLRSAGLPSARRRRSLVIGARTENDAEAIRERVLALPLPAANVTTGRTSRIAMMLYALFERGDSGAGPG